MLRGRKSMAAVSLKSLFGKLNPLCLETLHGAVGLCRSRRNDYVEVEHWLAKLIEPPDTDVARLLRHYDVNVGRVGNEVTRTLDKLRRGTDANPGWSLGVEEAVREAWVLASLEFNAATIRSGFLLATLLTERGLSMKLLANVPSLSAIPADRLLKELRDIIASSVEDQAEAAAPGAPAPAGSSRTPSLDQFTMNLTERAKKGEIDPV